MQIDLKGLSEQKRQLIEWVLTLNAIEQQAIEKCLDAMVAGESELDAWKKAIDYLSAQPGHEKVAERWWEIISRKLVA